MFLNIENRKKDSILAVDSQHDTLNYGELYLVISEIQKKINNPSVIFILCNNTVGALMAYLSSVCNKLVPLLLNINIDRELFDNLLNIYKPSYIWAPSSMDNFNYERIYEKKGFFLLKTNYPPYPIHKDLELLMTTSGSTGSPKLVRYKKGNLEANAKNVAIAFNWNKNERPLCDLPMNYTMGLNVINTHIYVGATVYLTNENIMSSNYWKFISDYKLTNMTGVPFSYELMLKLRFTKMDLPYMKTLAQGGGKLSDKVFSIFADYAKENQKRFIATFGTTETSARMSILEPDYACEKIGSIGKAIPEGRLFLIDEKGNEIFEEETEGELAYTGPNVTMGYAINQADLLKDDDFCGEYHTGDLAKKDADGFFYILGRKSRFLKLLGYRISLDECERLIKDQFQINCACTGTDEKMLIYLTREDIEKEVKDYISSKTGLFESVFEIRHIDDIPLSDSGKIAYQKLSTT